jgi:hypothetical protein
VAYLSLANRDEIQAWERGRGVPVLLLAKETRSLSPKARARERGTMVRDVLRRGMIRLLGYRLARLHRARMARRAISRRR